LSNTKIFPFGHTDYIDLVPTRETELQIRVIFIKEAPIQPEPGKPKQPKSSILQSTKCNDHKEYRAITGAQFTSISRYYDEEMIELQLKTNPAQ
jgi:hypothetical protein